MIYMALNEHKNTMIGIKQISFDLDIPRPFLSKILQQLAKQKLLVSNKGPNGGFILAKKALQISIMDIVSIIDGPDFFENCLIGLKTCRETIDHAHCPVHEEYSPIRAQLRQLFENRSIGQLARSISESGGTVRV